jgi:F-type H+-transporting ATPase subunit gamma
MSLEQARNRHRAIESIHDVVSAMRAIAAGRIQAAQRALANARRYREIVLRGMATVGTSAVFSSDARAGGKALFVVMTSQQPLCGPFNQNLIAFAERRIDELRQTESVHLLAIGQRGTRQMAARGLKPDESEPATTTLPGLRSLVRRLAHRIDHGYAIGELTSVRVIYNRYLSVSEQIPTEELILPIDPALFERTDQPPRVCCRYLPEPALLAGLIGQYAFISLYRAAAESFASEQASRLVAMDAATRNTERLAAGLSDFERRERQHEITRRMLELMAGRQTCE